MSEIRQGLDLVFSVCLSARNLASAEACPYGTQLGASPQINTCTTRELDNPVLLSTYGC